MRAEKILASDAFNVGLYALTYQWAIQKEYIKHISKNDKSITLKKRQMGITTANLCWNIYNCCNEKNVNSLILSNKTFYCNLYQIKTRFLIYFQKKIIFS